MLQVTNLTKSFGDLQVLKGVDFSIEKGQVVAVIGPSGSGKSTFLKTLNHLVQPDGGSMHFLDTTYDLARVSKREQTQLRRNMGMVFQNFGLFAHLSVERNITLALEKLHGIKTEEASRRAIHLLSTVGLLEKRHAYPAQLSGGQQQRVGIARALAPDPELLLFDEPTSALDPELIGEVLQVIRDLAKQGNTMVIVTHEMSFARDVADRILFMDGGQVVMEGTPEEVFSVNAHPRVRQFLERFTGGGI